LLWTTALAHTDMIKAISWNIAHRPALWNDVAALDADVALLQEAPEPPREIAARTKMDLQVLIHEYQAGYLSIDPSDLGC
jgi:hypothetical protein